MEAAAETRKNLTCAQIIGNMCTSTPEKDSEEDEETMTESE